MQLLGLGLIGYGFLKGKLYRNSDSLAGRRLGIVIATFYVFIGLAMLLLPLRS